MKVANRSACINQTAYDGNQWGALSVVTWFCSEVLISSSHFPFPSSLSSRAAAYLYAPLLLYVRVIVFMCQFHSGTTHSPCDVCLLSMDIQLVCLVGFVQIWFICV